jgi:glycosyltransferase involved in cell wall biosynthesis
MTTGTPVICGRNSSFEEVVGKAGHYVDVKDISEIRKTLRQATLYESEDKIEEGLRQSARFDKNESLKKIVSVYENTVY